MEVTNKKYELIESDKPKMYWVKALRDFGRVKAGDIGGYVESEHNLSHAGNCWVYGGARVFDAAMVCEDAQVHGNARVFGNAYVCEDAQVHGNTWVFDNARVYGDAWVYGNAQVFENARVYGNAKVYGNVRVFDNAKVYGDALVFGNARVFGDDRVTGKVLTFGGYEYHVTVTDNHVNIGCKQHTLEHWLEDYQEIGKAEGMSELEINAYGSLLKTIAELKQI